MCHKDMVASAIISNLARSAPFLDISEAEIEQNRRESWEKEINATQGNDVDPHLDYDVWFSDNPSARQKPLSASLPAAPLHNQRIHDAFVRWRTRISGTTLFPQMQAIKSVSRSTAYMYRQACGHDEKTSRDHWVSSADLERFYAQSGMRIMGTCELRQAWKYNDLTPRTYFSQGGQAYHASKYIRHIANTLSESFPQTHFSSRFSYHDLPIDSSDAAFIYDYSSFTSNLCELRYFLRALSAFCMDTEVLLVDSNRGILRASLGHVIFEYNEICNVGTEFDVIRYLGRSEILVHQKAGLLGVYGNIVFSTVLHGCHACQLAGDRSDCKCVGDDVFGVATLHDPWEKNCLLDGIESIGSIHRAKVRWWDYRPLEDEDMDDVAWPYVKRPFYRSENRMILEAALFLPIFGLVVPSQDALGREPEDEYVQIKLLITQTFACIRQLRALFNPPDHNAVTLLRSYLRMLYKHHHLPLEGRLPFEHFQYGRQKRTMTGFLLPNIAGDFFDEGQWDLLKGRWENRTSVVVSVPVAMEEELELEDLFRNRHARGPMTRVISYMRDMEWVEALPVREERYMEYSDYCQFYEQLLSGRVRLVYDLRVIGCLPTWYKDLINVV